MKTRKLSSPGMAGWMAIMVSIQPEDLETSLAEIRRALFPALVATIRERSLSLPDPEEAIAAAIRQSRLRKADSAGESSL